MPNNAALLQSKLNSAASGGRRVDISGSWDIDHTIFFPPSAGLELHGKSMHGTVLRWTGPPDVPMFVRRDVRDSVIANFKIELQTNLLTAFETGRATVTPGSTNTTNNHTKRIYVEPGGHRLGTYHQYGGNGYDGWVYPDANNEANVDEDIYAGSTTFGIMYNGHQCKANHALRCRFQGNMEGTYGIVAWGGSFLATLCGGGGFMDAFFRVYNQTDSILILWPDVETTARLLHTTGPTGGKTGSTQAITIMGGSYRSDLMPPDRYAVLVQHGGIVRLEGIQIGAGLATLPIIRADGFQSHLSAHGVDFAGYGSTPENSFSAAGDVYFDIGMNTYHKPDDGSETARNSYTVRGIPTGDTPVHPSTNEYQHGHV